MASAAESACNQAVAYLKAKEFGTSENEVSLSFSDSPVLTDLSNGLCVTYVVDTGGHFRCLQNRDTDSSGMSATQIHEVAVNNLADMARDRLQVRPYGNIFAVILDGNFEASLILVDGLWKNGLAHLAPNGFVAALPTRDILAFCDVESTEGVAELHQLIERVKNGDHPLSSRLFSRIAGEWRPL